MATIEASVGKTPAQLMAERDAAQAAHHVTVEDVVDEEDIEHPPPSQQTGAATATESPATNGSAGVMSTKAAGKQKEKPDVLNTQDEDAFPTLGGQSKPTAQAPGWGSKGTLRTPASPALSGASTPARPASRGPAMPGGAVNLPSQNRDHFDISKQDMNPNAPIQKVLADAKRKYKVNTGIQEISGGRERRFYAEGPQKAQVRAALLDISKAISVEKDIKLQIPASASAAIIGKGGSNITAWQNQHGVRINIKRDPREPSDDPNDPRIDVVELKGDAASVREVQYKIGQMVKQNQPKVNMPLRGVPPELYPFLAGQYKPDIDRLQQGNGLDINIPQYHTWQAQPPPRAAADGRAQFVPHGDSHIMLSGEQESAMQAQRAIEQLVKQLQEQLAVEEMTSEQVLHPYIVGERGMDPIDFLDQTGCAIVLPPGHHESDDIHIVGPQDRIQEGRDLAERLMAEKHTRPIDLSRQFASAPMGADRHSRALAKYLQEKAIEREIMNAHNSEVVFPVHAGAGPNWNIISSDAQKAVAAKNDITKITQAFPPSRISLLEMDPYYHQHVGDMFSQQLQNDHGVFMMIPDDPEEPIMLVYEGPEEADPYAKLRRGRPTSPEQQEFERALQAAQDFLLGQIPSRDIHARDVPVPRKHHERVRRHVRNLQQETPAQFPVQLDFGQPSGRRARAQQPQVAENVFLRGPSPDEVEALRQQIENFLLELEQDEKERDYTTTFDFPENFKKNLIGKNGANIQTLREKHDVEIHTKEPGKVVIQGPQKKADACKAEIVRLGKQYEDEVSYTIKVDPKFHGELIGKSGENLTKLQNKVNREVRIDFPRANRGGDTSDNVSEAGGSTQRQASDEIKIRGPRAKADKIRDELLSLTQYLQDNSHTATVSVHRDQVRSLIGRGGSELERLRGETGAQVDVPNKPEGERVTITIKGSKAAVDKARQEIQSKAKAFDAITTQTIAVDRKYHRDLIGSKGLNIQKIVHEAGGPERSAEAVQFPKQGEDSSTLTIKGTQDVVDKIVSAINSFVEERDNQVTQIVDIPADQHRMLIGSAGNIRKSIEQQFSIALDVPRRETGSTGVKITGRSDAVAQAKQHIIHLTKQPEGTTVMVPRNVHHVVANDGRFFRDLSRQGIKVDHKGQQPPRKPAAQNGSRARVNADAPLITDDVSDSIQHAFNLQLLNALSEETGEIPWVLIGNRDVTEADISKVAQQIQDAISQAEEPRHIGYLRLSDPALHRHVIGQGGRTINSIRKRTGCDIQVPGGAKSQNQGEDITIVGGKDDIEMARDLILEEIEKAGS
ncbi:hypothetical protein LTS08_003513 [Lithohypha guttulata]|nr:hypothetical protein LTS08_003513 [Lithohypha guttulata]